MLEHVYVHKEDTLRGDVTNTLAELCAIVPEVWSIWRPAFRESHGGCCFELRQFVL